MCFTVLKELPYPVKLSFDLEVVKYGSDISKGLDGSVYFHASQTGFAYAKDMLSPIVPLRRRKNKYLDLYEINKGYHSFYRYINTYPEEGDEETVSIFIIPKNTPFYVNTCGEMVSERIKFVDVFSSKNLEKYKQLELTNKPARLTIQNKLIIQKLEGRGININ